MVLWVIIGGCYRKIVGDMLGVEWEGYGSLVWSRTRPRVRIRRRRLMWISMELWARVRGLRINCRFFMVIWCILSLGRLRLRVDGLSTSLIS